MKTKVGDKVWLAPCSGFCGESWKYLCLIIDCPVEECMICNDPKCKEYNDVALLDEEGKIFGYLPHVSECQMYDTQQIPDEEEEE
jgi:hypothetical protein